MNIKTKLLVIAIIPAIAAVVVSIIFYNTHLSNQQQAAKNQLFDTTLTTSSQLALYTYQYLRLKYTRVETQWRSLHKTLTDQITSLESTVDSGRKKQTLEQLVRRASTINKLFVRLTANNKSTPQDANEIALVEELNVRVGNQLLSNIDAIYSDLLQLNTYSMRTLQLRQNTTTKIVIISVALICIITFIGVFFTSNTITGPIQALVTGAGKMAEGDLSYRVNCDTQGELHVLATEFNDMATKIAKSQSDLRGALEKSRSSEQLLQGAELKLQKWNSELENQVNLRTTQLSSANRELESFAYSVAHDLRTPLRGIDGFSKLLQENNPEHLDQVSKQYIKRIRQSTQHMSDIIDALLTLSRTARAMLQYEKVDLQPIAESIITRLRESDPTRTLEFTSVQKMVANTDPKLIAIALENLLGNAWKYTLMKTPAVINFGIIQGEETVFFVRDNGCGFDMQYKDKLFSAFQRLHSAREFSGAGIGLATVARIVERHGGRIWAEAEVNKGACFYFTIKSSTDAQQ